MGNENGLVIPSPEEFAEYIKHAAQVVVNRLLNAGTEYGEEVLFTSGQAGAVILCYTKSARALYSFKRYPAVKVKDDTFLDLAGYAVLELARRDYLEQALHHTKCENPVGPHVDPDNKTFDDTEEE